MKRRWILLLVVLFGGCSQNAPLNENAPIQNVAPNLDARAAKFSQVKEKVAPFFKLMGKPLDTDWLATFKEPGQTFEEYTKSNPTLPTDERKTIYIQPLGKFSATERKVLQLTAEYMHAFYNLPVKLETEKSLESVPKELTRKNPLTNQTQIKTTYFLDDLLPKIIPKDAAALICFTSSDIFPEADWSYVFGQASFEKRVGVWSLARLGKPDKSKNDYQVFLLRTLKIAMHETGHMFSLHHCTKYECLMSGTNNLNETDRRPADVCPECAAKIWWAFGYDPAARYRNLAKFWSAQGQTELSREFEAKANAVGQN